MCHLRGVAQSGRVLGLGPRCRRFESSRPDHKFKPTKMVGFNLCLVGPRFDTLQRIRHRSYGDAIKLPGSTMS